MPERTSNPCRREKGSDGGGNRRRRAAGARCHHHRLVGWQFEHDRQFSRVHAHLPHRRLKGGAGSGALLAQHPGCSVEHIESGEIPTVSEGMGGAGHHQKLVGYHGLHHQCWLVDPALDETDLRQTVEHGLRHRFRIADIEFQRDTG